MPQEVVNGGLRIDVFARGIVPSLRNDNVVKRRVEAAKSRQSNLDDHDRQQKTGFFCNWAS